MKKKKLIRLTAPGEILKEEFLEPLELKESAVAKALGVPQSRLSEIVHGKRAITLDTAVRLSKYFSTTPQFWLNLQNNYDLQKMEEVAPKGLMSIKPYRAKVRRKKASRMIVTKA